ncbi:molybdopterin-binding protein [Niveibacterium sp. SC-1]|uniref:competence/damage-inducible protein A n=1 Tax=Niveibacterium sp. SC-1 TaxID=3135646 RepID=UPI00311F443A
MAIGILIIGDEILSGRREDKHLAKSIELLSARGLRLSWVRMCGDDRPLLVQTLRECFATGDTFFSFGGIGATPDDHTRQAVAAARDVELALHPEAEAEIRGRFGAETTPGRLEMGRLPADARIVPNPYNRIPGFATEQAYFLPGFPVMAWPMMSWVLDTELAHLHHADDHIEASVWVFDAQESQLTPLMQALQDEYGVVIFSLPNTLVPGGRRQIELGAKGTEAAVVAAMQVLRKEVVALGFALAEIPPRA